ncbi:MAG: hypothetical protein R3C97_15630 [Geminicoccaceae bacterium]
MINGVPISGALNSISISEVKARMGDKYARLEATVHQTYEASCAARSAPTTAMSSWKAVIT